MGVSFGFSGDGLESRKLIPGRKLDQDSGLRAQVAPGGPSKKGLRAGLAAISTLVSAHKQEDQTAFGAGTMVNRGKMATRLW